MSNHLDIMVLHGYMQRLLATETIAEVSAVAADVCREQGFDNTCYGLLLPVSPTRPPRLVIFGNWPEELRNYYMGSDFLHLDPCVESVLNGTVAMTWDHLDYTRSSEQREFHDVVLAHGLRAGMHFGTFVRGGELSCMSFTRDRAQKALQRDLEHQQPFMHLLFAHIHQAAARISRADAYRTEETLTTRELECLRWAAEGKTAAEIGLILTIAENTAIRHLANASRKLGTVNRTHAVAKAIITRLIAPF